MSPLVLNLLAEEQAAEAASARDPVKFAILIGLVVVGVAAGWGAVTALRAERAAAEADRLQKRWNELTSAPAGGTFRALKALAEDLVEIHQRRVLLAPELARIKDLVPDSIYLTRAMFRMNVEVAAAPAVVGGEKETPRVTRPSAHEWLLLRIEGTATGAPPELEVDGFLRVLRTDPGLSNEVKEITLRSIGRTHPGSESASKTNVAQFVIECVYKEKR
ncbi:MAG: hypothetical protein N3B01_12165 [Verrucomicrobiae bacterium]|nr:hypothetical protein [Verrucomicrobiae bacterium]